MDDSILKNEKSGQRIRLDWYTMSKDIIREWSIIVMISIAAVLFSYTLQYLRYSPTYSMKATFTVNSRVAVTDIYSNLSKTSSTADTFAEILDSELMKKKVGEDVGTGYMPGTVTVNMVEDTNILELTVVESTPKLTSEVYRSILNNYNEVSGPLLGDVVLTTLIDSEIPTKADHNFDPWHGMLRAFLIAFAGTILFLFALSYLKDTVRREEDIEDKLDTKLLGTLVHEKKYKKGFGKNSVETKTILINDPMVSFRYTESVKKIAGKIVTKMDRRGLKSILITSVMENEGKSTVAANIALALSKRSDKVLLIDGDFRKPALYKIFDINPDTIDNFGEVLNGNADLPHLICRKDNVNLSMILNSVRFPDSTDMISQDLMPKIIHLLEQRFDYIVIDSSPMAMVADTQEWMEIIGASIIVVRQNSSTVRDINDSIAMLNRDDLKLLGCIFNNVEGRDNHFVSRNYRTYGRYGRYGKYGKYGKYEDAAYSDYSEYKDYHNHDSVTDTGVEEYPESGEDRYSEDGKGVEQNE